MPPLTDLLLAIVMQLRQACQAKDVQLCKQLAQAAKDAVSLLQQQMEYFTKLLQQP